jgi:hypothetical protein
MRKMKKTETGIEFENEQEMFQILGIESEARVHGILRGGYLFQGVFGFHAGTVMGWVTVPVESTSDWRVTD